MSTHRSRREDRAVAVRSFLSDPIGKAGILSTLLSQCADLERSPRDDRVLQNNSQQLDRFRICNLRPADRRPADSEAVADSVSRQRPRVRYPDQVGDTHRSAAYLGEGFERMNEKSTVGESRFSPWLSRRFSYSFLNENAKNLCKCIFYIAPCNTPALIRLTCPFCCR